MPVVKIRTASWRPNEDPGLSCETMECKDCAEDDRVEAVDLPVAGRRAMLEGEALVEGREGGGEDIETRGSSRGDSSEGGGAEGRGHRVVIGGGRGAFLFDNEEKRHWEGGV